MDPGGGRRPSASLCGKTFGFAERNQNSDRCFRESRRHPRAQSKLLIQEQMPKVKRGKFPVAGESPEDETLIKINNESAWFHIKNGSSASFLKLHLLLLIKTKEVITMKEGIVRLLILIIMLAISFSVFGCAVAVRDPFFDDYYPYYGLYPYYPHYYEHPSHGGYEHHKHEEHRGHEHGE